MGLQAHHLYFCFNTKTFTLHSLQHPQHLMCDPMIFIIIFIYLFCSD